MQVIKPPQSILTARPFKVFLAGSIEMGVAEPWQEEVENYLLEASFASSSSTNCTLYNPRREKWDSTWEQSINNDPFYEQVRWELNAIDDSNMIAMYFDPNTKSPITLMELGLYASSGKMVVCCPNGYYRKGNVDIVCERYNIKMVQTKYDLFKEIKERVTEYNH